MTPIKIEKKALRRSFWNWFFFTQGNHNFETMQSSTFILSMIPIAQSLYPNDAEKQKEMLKRHMQFYNTEPQVGTVINGITASFEESLANGNITPEVIQTTKIGLMGPVAGIGDALIQGMIVPLLLSLGISLSAGTDGKGSLLGPLFYMFTFIPVIITLSYWLYMEGYRLGFSSVKILLSGQMRKITASLNILALVVVGGIAASYVSVVTPITIGGVPLQEQLDDIFPHLLPLGVVILSYYLLGLRKMTALKLMFILFVSSIFFSYTGIL
jgi:mannose/fructose/N-acetylgalactosamine-specific phosphotransferase system component IID